MASNAEKAAKLARKVEIAEQKAAIEAKKRELAQRAADAGYNVHDVKFVQTKSVNEHMSILRKKTEAKTKKAVANSAKAAKAARGVPPKKTIKNTLKQEGFSDSLIGRLSNNVTLSAARTKATERLQKKQAKVTKEQAEQELKDTIKAKLGNRYNSANYKKPKKGQNAEKIFAALTKRLDAKEKKRVKEAHEQAIKAALKANGFNNTNIKVKKGETLSAAKRAAAKRVAAKTAKAAKEAYLKRIKNAANAAGIEHGFIKVRGKFTNSTERKALNAAIKRRAAKTLKNTREGTKRSLLRRARDEGISAKHVKFTGTKGISALLADARKRHAAANTKVQRGTAKQAIMAALAPLNMSDETIKKVICSRAK
jgi:hypothetical protein